MIEVVPASDTDIDIAARTLWGECRGEPELGQQAVAWVIRTRALWRPATWWGDTILRVCLHPQQFSCWNADSPEKQEMDLVSRGDPAYESLRTVVEAVFSGRVPDPTKGATGYQRVGTGAPWSKGKPIAALIGKHEFYAIPPGG